MPLASLPSRPSTLTLFQCRRWPPTCGISVPKSSPSASDVFVADAGHQAQQAHHVPALRLDLRDLGRGEERGVIAVLDFDLRARGGDGHHLGQGADRQHDAPERELAAGVEDVLACSRTCGTRQLDADGVMPGGTTRKTNGRPLHWCCRADGRPLVDQLTAAPGTAWLDSSTTVPEMVPVVPGAAARPAPTRNAASAAATGGPTRRHDRHGSHSPHRRAGRRYYALPARSTRKGRYCWG